jgi:hypothetical protein
MNRPQALRIPYHSSEPIKCLCLDGTVNIDDKCWACYVLGDYYTPQELDLEYNIRNMGQSITRAMDRSETEMSIFNMVKEIYRQVYKTAKPKTMKGRD